MHDSAMEGVDGTGIIKKHSIKYWFSLINELHIIML